MISSPRRAFVATVVVALCFAFEARVLPLSSPPSQDLVLVGTMTAIRPVHVPRSRQRWEVTVKVDKVLSGDVSGSTFSFAVHSATKAGLQLGGTYTIKATWNGSG